MSHTPPLPNPLPQVERENHTASPRILIIRRDNIGDLVCTTPLIRALRERFPNAWIGVMANSYNAPVLNGNADLDGVYVYTKAKHRAAGERLIGIFFRRIQMLYALRAMQIDDVIIATTTPQPRVVRMARWLKPQRVIAFGPCGADIELPLGEKSLHEVEDVFRGAALYDIQRAPPACVVVSPNERRDHNTIAIHISARKSSQRWATEHFVALMRKLHDQDAGLRFVLLWSPGANDDPRHPGDDAKAALISRELGADFPAIAVETPTLPTLIAALARCGAIICADGGAMHLAAGLGLPIVALFGDSSIARWHPWAVPQRVLQAQTRHVADISVAEVSAAFNALKVDIPGPTV